MRALCGAIITAGAMIGLGLAALGFGVRFQGAGVIVNEGGQLYGIPSMVTILVVLVLGLLIGLGVAFMGLAFHHERRLHERHGHLHGATMPVGAPSGVR